MWSISNRWKLGQNWAWGYVCDYLGQNRRVFGDAWLDEMFLQWSNQTKRHNLHELVQENVPSFPLLIYCCFYATLIHLVFWFPHPLIPEDVIESTNSQGRIILLLWLTSSTKPPIRGSPISTRYRPRMEGGTLSTSRLTTTGLININTPSRRKLKLSPHSSSTRKLIKNPTARSSRPEGSPSTRARPSFTRLPSALPRGRIGLRASRSPDPGANSWKGAK